jgi:phosphoesterase RecJ-like protein
VSSLDRLGILSVTAEAAPNFAAIDHHASYTGFARTSVVDITAPATAVMTLELVDRLGVELDAQIATCVYAGLITDTGSFRYFGTTPETHHIAARLLATGIRHDIISRQIYDDEPFAAVKLLGIALSRAELDAEAVGGLGAVSTYVTAADRHSLDLPIDAVERVIDELRVATEAEVSVVMKQEDLGAWRVSLRSKGRVDVSRATVQLGGGGHRFAAGYTTSGDRTELLCELVEVLNSLPLLAE